MKFSELKKELDEGKVRNVYIFTGPEKEVMNKYIKRIGPKNNKAKSFNEILPRLTTKNLFASKQVFVIEDDKGATEWDYEEIKKLVGSNIVIFVFKDIDKRKKLFKKAEKDIVEFKRFDESELVWFIQKIIDVPDNLAMLIARYCGNDVARIENECHKLSFLGKEITEEIVKELIHPPIEDRIFDMIDFVAKKKKQEVFKLYYDLLELKESPIKIISLLYTKFKHVFLVQTYYNLQNVEIAGKTGLTFFQVNMARSLVGSFTLEELVSHMHKIQDLEVKIKTGQIDQYLGMENLLLDILR
jgi:DNA polymerase III subunit delta